MCFWIYVRLTEHLYNIWNIMTLVTEYTTTKKALDDEVERWERFSEELETINQ